MKVITHILSLIEEIRAYLCQFALCLYPTAQSLPPVLFYHSTPLTLQYWAKEEKKLHLFGCLFVEVYSVKGVKRNRQIPFFLQIKWRAS